MTGGTAGPIPPLQEPPRWARLPIVEGGEALVALAADGEGRLRVRAQYALEGIPGAPETVWVRAGVHERLLRAAQTLPAGIALLVFDGFRPLAVQRYLYDHFRAKVAAANPGFSPPEIEAVVARFVASPSADPRCPPPHRTGGAVDVCLVDAASGFELLMGTAPDEVAPESATRYYEDFPEEPFTTNRRLLFHAMTGAGFTNYEGEWWHFDYGNQRWANCAGRAHAVYGAVPEPA